MDFIDRYTYAETFKQKAHCVIAKLLRGHVITPLGRIMLLPSDYKKIENLFCISDGKKCEDICKHAPPSNKWPCVDCDTRCHDRAEQKDAKDMVTKQEIEEALRFCDSEHTPCKKVHDLLERILQEFFSESEEE